MQQTPTDPDAPAAAADVADIASSTTPETATEAQNAAPQIISDVTERIQVGAQSLSCYAVNFISKLGLPIWLEPIVSGAFLFICLAILSFLIFFIIRPFVVGIFSKIVSRTEAQWDDKLVKYGIAKWLSHFISALLINFLIRPFFDDTPEIRDTLEIVAKVYLVLSGLFTVNSFLNAARSIYSEAKPPRHRVPATSLTQVLKLVAFIVAAIFLISTLIGKSPVAFLGGLGVFTSVIMLVFKDAILGFVAGIQLTSNDMIKEGDWIEMPKHGADGDVLEVGLTTVKVLNFDKTVTTIPTYAMISESFKNWRTMPESGGRRIKRSIYIDSQTIQLCDGAMLDRFREIDLISDYVDERLGEINDWNEKRGFDPDASPINGRQLTNIGTYRAYILAYLRNSPFIHQSGMTLLVRQLAPGATGVPIEIYCFSNITNWTRYEEIQSDIFDHLMAVAEEFELRLFQNPTSINSDTTVQMYGLHHTAISSDKVVKD